MRNSKHGARSKRTNARAVRKVPRPITAQPKGYALGGGVYRAFIPGGLR